MQTHAALRSEEASEAAWSGGRGAVVGAARWGMYGAILAGAGYFMSPVYRGLTIQFKVYLQMSAMILGGCLEADHSIREYEAKVRMHKRLMRDREVWEKYQEEYEQASPTPKT